MKMKFLTTSIWVDAQKNWSGGLLYYIWMKKKEDLMFFWRNERYEAKAVTKCLRQ